MADARTQARSAILSSIETYSPASYRGGILALHYARARELEPWLDLVAVRGEVIGARYLAIGAGDAARYGSAGMLAAVVLSVRVSLVRGAGKAN